MLREHFVYALSLFKKIVIILTCIALFRVIDFVNDTVRTLAGNGTKGSDYDGGGRGTNQVLHWNIVFYFLQLGQLPLHTVYKIPGSF